MNLRFLPLLALVLVLTAIHSSAATTRYVNASNPNPAAPYTSWATAATNIQDAATFGGFGDTVLVTNGIYQYGGTLNSGSNRVNVVGGVTLQSVNGPAVTVIMGYQVPGTTNGNNAVRCVYLGSSATLSGFTLTNGATQTSGFPNAYGGGVYCATANCLVTNCVISGNSAASLGGGVYAGNLWNCTVSGNTAPSAGGVYQAALNNCIVTANRAISGGASGGGGASSSTLTNCIISGNTAAYPGGGVAGGTLVNCIISSNSAPTASGMGSATAYNCLFYGNTNGSSAYLSTLYNCTLAGNFSTGLGTADACKLNNSIIYYNSNSFYADCYQCTLTNCCTPLGNGTTSLPNNSISNAPAFVDMAHGNFHLQIGSPGMDGGTNIPATGVFDLDGKPRIVNGFVDMGAYEVQNTNPVHYVCMTNGTPVAPYTNWLTAATNIQDAIAVAQPTDFVVVSNGFYKGGGGIMFGSESNRVMVTNQITVLGLYGADYTVIVGSFFTSSATRCAYVGSNSVLYGFTLANGTTRTSGDPIKEESGGGAWCEKGGVISNCVFGGANFPYATGSTPSDACTAFEQGGAVYGGTIYNSTLANNTATALGGAAAAAALVNCVIETNSSAGGYAGGLYQGVATNCTFIGNLASEPITGRAGGAYQSILNNCTFIRNQGQSGGAALCTNYNCTFVNNGGTSIGGGTYGGILYNCLVSSNTAGAGGGAFQSTLYNCLVISNRATSTGGGTYGSTLVNCTISTNTSPQNDGGGGYQGTYYNCTISGNTGGGASVGTLYGCRLTGNTNANGGGALNCTLVNCLLTGNYATSSGGGASGGTLRNCTVVSNAAAQTGGVAAATVYNSIVYYNSIVSGTATNYSNGSINYCDTYPAPGGFGSITNEPGFVNLAAGDFHLQSASPCINSGNNAYVTTNVDFGGSPRTVGGTVDIGAYEYQTPASVISYAYLQQYGLPTDGSVDYADADGDGMTTWQEWKSGTVPTDATSVLQMSSSSNSVSGMVVSWQSVANVTYFLQRSGDLSAQPAFTTIQNNLVGQAGVTSYLDTDATNSSSYFYRVGVQ